MSWQDFLARGEVKEHRSTPRELDNMRALIERDLADAGVAGLSADRRFATAYNAALQAAAMTVHSSGYRVSARAGHHAVTFEAARLAMGESVAPFTDYFDACRRKRNTIDYQNTSVATETEAREIVQKATAFYRTVERWLSEQAPAGTR